MLKVSRAIYVHFVEAMMMNIFKKQLSVLAEEVRQFLKSVISVDVPALEEHVQDHEKEGSHPLKAFREIDGSLHEILEESRTQ